MSDRADIATHWQQLIEMAAPPRRIVACPKAANLCPIEYGLDTTANPVSRDMLGQPKGFDRTQHQRGIDLIDGQLAERRISVSSERVQELDPRLTAPLGLVLVEISLRGRLEIDRQRALASLCTPRLP